jgi:hypothetical protein
MMRPILLAAIAAMLLLAPGIANAQNDVVPIRAADGPVTIKPDRAYILFRTNRAKSGIIPINPIFLRVPSEAEIADYRAARQAAFAKDLPKLTKAWQDAGRPGPGPDVETYGFTYKGHINVFDVDSGKYIADAPNERAYLAEVPPGDYVLYGSGMGGSVLSVCNCLGTVGFHAGPGVVTDLGTLLINKAQDKSPEPELATETDLGKSYGWGMAFVFAEAVRPATAQTPLPALIPADKRRIVEYHAVGPFFEPGAAMVNRLAPLPGVLRYDNGKVVDVRTGEILP